ncbi:MAG: sel1 repeat family protein [Nitrospina sp.]|nr:sel1 repeat family protein [Nitrospina sp.]MBT3855962.1 sel1 repeat family protein [Nitrospina sp.]MBT4620090.1 sel1 repeat family protein [Nitrospina sp.]MBT5259651.1 sel1 repeat family protein [Nitrospina sp.]MBT5957418.1 sel1 repeat family protein [Nitrospina sp.]
MKRLIPVLLMLVLVSAPVYAGDFQDGENAYRKGDYRTAFEKFEPLAEQGNAQAQWLLAGLYARGMGVARDYVQALKWSAIAGANGVEAGSIGRDLLQKKMTPDQINKAFREAGEWMREYNKK